MSITYSPTHTTGMLFTVAEGKVAEIQDFFTDFAVSDRVFSDS